MADYQTTQRDYGDGRRGEFGKRDGKRHGPWRTFYANGNPHIDRTFVNGREHGNSRTWNTNGQLIDEKQFQDGALHGHWRIWNDEGELIQDCNFTFGNQIKESEVSKSNIYGKLESLLVPFQELTLEQSAKYYPEALSSLSVKSVIATAGNDIPSASTIGSCIGTVTHLPVNAEWPTLNGAAMVPLIQLVTRDLPHCPYLLENIAFIAVFGPSSFPFGDGVDELKILQAESLDGLTPITAPAESLRRSPVVLDFTVIDEEYPNENDLPPGLKAFIEDNDPNSPILEHACETTTKIGGWPSWIQFTSLNGFGDLVLQIDSCDFEDWDAGDATVFYCFMHPETGEISSHSEMC